MNPPYAEASNKGTLIGRKEGNRGVEQSKINQKYKEKLGQGNAELFAQFLARIYVEIPDSIIGHFSTLKMLSGQHFIDFRKFFLAKLAKAFICPADTFDNVKGQFPIAFMIWDTAKKEQFEEMVADVHEKNGNFKQKKGFYAYQNSHYINDWIKPFRGDIAKNQLIGKFPFAGNDFQHQDLLQVIHHQHNYSVESGQFLINQRNVKYACIYFAVRKCIKAIWLNNNDQFLYPNGGWEIDTEFQNDCLVYALFNNKIQSQYGTNHWIPFSEYEIDAKAKFESNFMSKYIAGKIDTEITFDLFGKVEKEQQKPILFSPEAKALFEAGKKLWRYYHAQKDVNVNASLYDIRAYFQGRNEGGKMKNKSEDETYTKLIADLREKLKQLAHKIEPKVYEFGFLKGL